MNEIAQNLFIKFLALSYFFAFYSLSKQVLGLFGSKGIIPIADSIAYLGQHFSNKRFQNIPTLFWWKQDDHFIQNLCQLGIILSILCFFGFFPAGTFVFLFFLYLSFLTVGSPFLNYQWDVLLLEIGFAAIFYSLMTPPNVVITLWLWLLLFRFIFASGLVKLLSGCPEWKSLKALHYHFETQPLPNLGGFWAHHLHSFLKKILCLLVLILEIGVPFLFFLNSSFRLIGALLSILLQLIIILTGNYAFFNLLTIALIMPLIDEMYLKWLILPSIQSFPYSLFLDSALSVIGLFMIFCNVVILVKQIFTKAWMPEWLTSFMRFSIINTYGLFAVMTTERNEIVLEGSDDGVIWKQYLFKYKPNDLKSGVKQIAPFQPRLDWQMWFASLSEYRNEPWFHRFIHRLFQNSPDVLRLLAFNPFMDHPPRYLRAQFYKYNFTSFNHWWNTGEFWTRTYLGYYLPPVSLKI